MNEKKKKKKERKFENEKKMTKYVEDRKIKIEKWKRPSRTKWNIGSKMIGEKRENKI